jgi:hypothetical protein
VEKKGEWAQNREEGQGRLVAREGKSKKEL